MNQKTTFVLSYSTGQYDDYCDTVLAVMNDRDKVNALCDKFNEIVKHYENEFNAFHFLQKQTLLKWNLENGEIPQAQYLRLKKDSNPEWKNISNKEWQIFIAKHKESFDIASSKAHSMREARKLELSVAGKSFWDEVRAKMPDHLKDCIELYPCSETESYPNFSVEEVPIWK